MSPEKSKMNRLISFFKDEQSRLINYTRSLLGDYYFESDPDIALNIFSKIDLDAPVENLAALRFCFSCCYISYLMILFSFLINTYFPFSQNENTFE